MKSSISENKKILTLLSVVFWILVWWIAAIFIGEKLFLPTPLEVVKALFSLLARKEFWKSILFSSSRVFLAYFASFVFSLFMGVISGCSERFEILLSPLVKAMRSIPVASIVILALVWVKSRNLSLVVSFLVVFPILYQSIVSGVRNTDSLLLEAAKNYGIDGYKKVRYIYIPSIFPFLESGISSSLGLCWKSAVAAEVIGLPSHSMGEGLYEAKIYLDTPSLFAWTVVIVVLSVIFEKMILLGMKGAKRRALK